MREPPRVRFDHASGVDFASDCPDIPHLSRGSTPRGRRGESYLDGRERSSSLWRRIRAHAGERGNFKTDGGGPRPLIPGLAMGPGCAEQHPNKAREGQREMEVTTIGIDLAKNVFAVRDADGS